MGNIRVDGITEFTELLSTQSQSKVIYKEAAAGNIDVDKVFLEELKGLFDPDYKTANKISKIQKITIGQDADENVEKLIGTVNEQIENFQKLAISTKSIYTMEDYGVETDFSNSLINMFRDVSSCKTQCDRLVRAYGKDALEREDVKNAIRIINRMDTFAKMQRLRSHMWKMLAETVNLSFYKNKIDEHEQEIKKFVKTAKEKGISFSEFDNYIETNDRRVKELEVEISSLNGKKKSKLRNIENDLTMLKLRQKNRDIHNRRYKLKSEVNDIEFHGLKHKPIDKDIAVLEKVFANYINRVEKLEGENSANKQKIDEINNRIQEIHNNLAITKEKENNLIAGLKLDESGRETMNGIIHEIDSQKKREDFIRIWGENRAELLYLTGQKYVVDEKNDLNTLMDNTIKEYIKKENITDKKCQDLMIVKEFILYALSSKTYSLGSIHELIERSMIDYKKQMENEINGFKEKRDKLQDRLLTKSENSRDVCNELYDLREQTKIYNNQIQGLEILKKSYEEKNTVLEDSLNKLNRSSKIKEAGLMISDDFNNLNKYFKDWGIQGENIPESKGKDGKTIYGFYKSLKALNENCKNVLNEKEKKAKEDHENMREELEEYERKELEVKAKVTAKFDSDIKKCEQEIQNIKLDRSKVQDVIDSKNNNILVHDRVVKDAREIKAIRDKVVKNFDKAVADKIKDAIMDKYRSLNDFRRSRTNSKEYEAMIKPLCASLGLGIPSYGADLSKIKQNPDNSISAGDILKNLIVMRQNAESYIKAKNQQKNVLGTDQRYQRLSLAHQLIDMSNDMINFAADAYSFCDKNFGEMYKELNNRINNPENNDLPKNFYNSKTTEKDGFNNLLEQVADMSVKKEVLQEEKDLNNSNIIVPI